MVAKKLYGCTFQKRNTLATCRNVLVFGLLLLCGDIESCPGPCQNMDVFCNSKGLKIIHQNIRGLYSNVANIEILLSKQIDILTLSETHTLSHNSEIDFRIRGYNFILRSRKHGSRNVCFSLGNNLRNECRHSN